MRVDVNNSINGPAPKDPRAEAAKQGEKAGQVVPASTPDIDHDGDTDSGSSDTIEFSAGAQQLLEQGKGASGAVRPEMVERAKSILQSGSYNDKGAIEKTAEKIADSFSAEA